MQLTVGDKVTNIEVPFTLTVPTDEELKGLYTFNDAFYSEGIFTVVGNSVDMTNLISSTYIRYSEMESVEENAITVSSSIVSIGNGEYGETYQLTGAKLYYLGSYFDMPVMKIKFVEAASSTFVPTGTIELQSGNTESSVNLVYKDGKAKIYYVVNDKFGNAMEAADITSIKMDPSYVIPTGQNGNALFNIETDQTTVSTLVFTATNEVVSQDKTVSVNVIVTLTDGSTVKGTVNVKVKAMPQA